MNSFAKEQQFKGNVVHAIWFFARVKDTVPAKASTARARTAARTHRFKYQGHRVARTR